MAGIYIHIPFCRSRCIYCDFFSTTLSSAWHMPYVKALEREIEYRRHSPFGAQSRVGSDFFSEPMQTLYVGGGTPSQLTPEALQELFRVLHDHFVWSEDCEVTLEANPDDVTAEWIDSLKKTPVNRVSMGVQSLNDDILRVLHRRHSAAQARKAVNLLQEAGYSNLSIDLIYGLPGQTLAMFEGDVKEVLSWGIPHLSAYALQFEPDTPLSLLRSQGRVAEADEELSLACYERLMDLTDAAGLEHYEISNFAMPGYRSRHNSSYWENVPYLGLGAGAHSYDGDSVRSYNLEDVGRYVQSLKQNEWLHEEEILSVEERYNECVMLGLRTRRGVNLDYMVQKFGEERVQYLQRMAAPHLERGTLTKKAVETLGLTRRGLFVSDDIISDLML